MKNKTIRNVFATLSVAFCGALTTSCTNDNDLSNGLSAKEAQFQEAFIKQFGQIDKNNAWGFDRTCTPYGADTRSMGVRANVKHPYKGNPKFNNEEAEYVYKYISDNSNVNSASVNLRSFYVQVLYYDNSSNDIKVYGIYREGDKKIEEEIKMNIKKAETVRVDNNGTLGFAFRHGNGGKTKYNTKIFAISYNGTVGYYVGFDFGKNGTPGDGKYEDLILKIEDAFLPTPNIPSTARIIGEDLGSIGDFDYNDVVFDAYVYIGNDNKTYLDITILAAGGTKPIYVAGEEIHNLLGISTSTMANTRRGTVNVDAVTFTVKVSDEKLTYFDFNSIEVKTDDNVLTANRGAAPEKILVPTTFDWCDERININTQYPNFSRYVSSGFENWWK